MAVRSKLCLEGAQISSAVEGLGFQKKPKMMNAPFSVGFP